MRDYKFFKISNFYFARYYYRFFGWKFSNWFVDWEFIYKRSVSVGILGWYRYWLAYKRLQAFLRHFSKNYFLYTSVALISTSPHYYAILKFYSEKLNQSYIIGYNREFFTRFYRWQDIYHSTGFDYKFNLRAMPHLAILLQGSFLGDLNYIKGLRRRNLTYFVIFSIFELFKAGGFDGFSLTVPPGLLMHYALAFAYNALARSGFSVANSSRIVSSSNSFKGKGRPVPKLVF